MKKIIVLLLQKKVRQLILKTLGHSIKIKKRKMAAQFQLIIIMKFLKIIIWKIIPLKIITLVRLCYTEIQLKRNCFSATRT